MDYPWPEAPERTSERIQGIVASVVHPHELRDLRIEWVTPGIHALDMPEAQWVTLRVTVHAGKDEIFQQEIWGPEPVTTWHVALWQFASHLEDWVCETRFAWGQQRHAVVPD